MITIDVSFILVILNFIFLLIVLSRVMYKPLKKFLSERQTFIISKMESTKQAELEAKKLVEKRQDELNNAIDEGKSLRQKAIANAELQARTIQQQAEERAVKIRQEADEQIEREREKVVKKISSDLASMVSDISGKFLSKKVDSKENTKIITTLIAKKES